MRPSRQQQGIGLTEVMVTLVIISIGILALVNFQSFAFTSAALASQRATAITLAQDKMAKLRAFSSVRGTTSQGFQGIMDGTSDPGISSFPNYTIETNVTNFCYETPDNAFKKCNSSPLPDLKRVTIEVSWTGPDGDDRDFTLSSFIASIDPSAAGKLYN